MLEDLGTATQRLAETLGAHRQDHEFLDVEIVVGVRAAVDDVHHRHRHGHRTGTAKIPIQRQPRLLSCGLGHGHRHGQDGVGAQARLVIGAVELDQALVDECLFLGIKADDRFGNFGVDVFYGLHHALAEIATAVVVPQFDCFP